MAEFQWWLLIVGLVAGGGLVAIVSMDGRRREEDLAELSSLYRKKAGENLPMADTGAGQILLGVSPRGTVMLHRAAQARAFLEGRDYCLPDDFKQLIIPVFSHRVVVSSRYVSTQKKSEQTEAILREILDTTRVPV